MMSQGNHVNMDSLYTKKYITTQCLSFILQFLVKLFNNSTKLLLLLCEAGLLLNYITACLLELCLICRHNFKNNRSQFWQE